MRKLTELILLSENSIYYYYELFLFVFLEVDILKKYWCPARKIYNSHRPCIMLYNIVLAICAHTNSHSLFRKKTFPNSTHTQSGKRWNNISFRASGYSIIDKYTVMIISEKAQRALSEPEGLKGHLNRILFFCKTVSHRESTLLMTPKDNLLLQIGVTLIHQLPYPVVSHVTEQGFLKIESSGEQWLVHLVWPNRDEIFSTDTETKSFLPEYTIPLHTMPYHTTIKTCVNNTLVSKEC